VPGKLLSSRRSFGAAICAGLALVTIWHPAAAQESKPSPVLADPPRFLGSASCSASLCHGGSGPDRGQFQIWSLRDYHTKARATLTLPRSARFAQALGLGEAAKNDRCTSCHDPWQNLPVARKGPKVNPADLVSCETCHGAAEPWIRAHTRPDWSHADRVGAGMRDLENLYVRASTCVACHQNVDSDLLKAGHPELIFELDGQSATEPKHWRERRDWIGPQSWLVGQAVALRESSWQLSREKAPHENLVPRCEALAWLLRKIATLEKAEAPAAAASSDQYARMREWSDQFARAAAEAEWSEAKIWSHLFILSESGDFKPDAAARPVQARRAERLVLGLDRLLLSLGGKESFPKSSQHLDELFHDVQSLPDFDPARFSKHLMEFQQALGAEKATRPLRAAAP
jgi:hypothetical protein